MRGQKKSYINRDKTKIRQICGEGVGLTQSIVRVPRLLISGPNLVVGSSVSQAHALLGQVTHKFEYFWGEKGVRTPVLRNHEIQVIARLAVRRGGPKIPG